MSETTFDTVARLIGPFDRKGVALSPATTFQGELEWDSLTVMDFVAAVEDDHEHAGGDRDGRPIGRCGREAEGLTAPYRNPA